ncbi:acetoin dehydrogenase complex dihydrolipoyllysine-residue acetyltransferase [soil metagenome]
MASPISIPRLGWNMDEGVFVGWLKQDGDTIALDDPLFTMEAEKSTEDIPSLERGTLHILPGGPRPGDTVPVGTVIGHLVADGEIAPSGAAPMKEEQPELPQAAQTPEVQSAGHKQASTPAPAGGMASRSHPAASPRARRVAQELAVDWTNLKGTGSTGRIRERDVRTLAAAGRSAPASPTRKRIAQRLQESLRNTVPVTLVTTADASNLVQLNRQFKVVGKQEGTAIPTYTDFLAKLSAGALQQHPQLNAHTDGEQIRLSAAIHIGIAVDTDAGLLVPVLRDVSSLTLRELSSRSRDLVSRARLGQLKAREMQDGTFTVSSLGGFGIDAFPPILNPPQVAILGVGRIQRRPAVRDDQVVIRDEITLSLTFDHASVDGAPAARFLQTLRERVENPGPWLIS